MAEAPAGLSTREKSAAFFSLAEEYSGAGIYVWCAALIFGHKKRAQHESNFPGDFLSSAFSRGSIFRHCERSTKRSDCTESIGTDFR